MERLVAAHGGVGKLNWGQLPHFTFHSQSRARPRYCLGVLEFAGIVATCSHYFCFFRIEIGLYFIYFYIDE